MYQAECPTKNLNAIKKRLGFDIRLIGVYFMKRLLKTVNMCSDFLSSKYSGLAKKLNQIVRMFEAR